MDNFTDAVNSLVSFPDANRLMGGGLDSSRRSTGKLVAEMAAGRAHDGESVLAGVDLDALKLGWARRD